MDPHDTHLDLRTLDLRGGQHAERLFSVDLAPVHLGGQAYQAVPKEEGIVVRVDRAQGGFLVTVQVRASVYGACMRCLEEVMLDVEAAQQEFVPTTREGWEEADLSPFIEDLVLDVPGLAREALILELPAKLVCDDTCRGGGTGSPPGQAPRVPRGRAGADATRF
jgi:uncharacterized metal-binding protein YceD (DUF177 family)